MLGTVTRNGQWEAVHHGSVAIVDSDGRLIASHGDIHRRYFIRSSAKPFLALVMQRFGAELRGEQLALAASSHSGTPEQITIVEQIMADVGLSATHLRTPENWPSDPDARDQYVRDGALRPRRIWHTCSGKHAALLRTCAASGFPLESYLEPTHPLQEAITALLSDVLGSEPTPIGVDGCGAPVAPTSTMDLARAYSKFATWDEMSEIYEASRDHPLLIGGVGEIDGILNTALGTAAKVGAEACLGVAFKELGLGVAVKVDDGSNRGRGAAMVGVLRYLDLLTPELEFQLLDPVLGGGERVGKVEAVLDLGPR